MPEYRIITVHMNSGKIIKVNAASYGCQGKEYNFENEEEDDFLRIPYLAVEYIDVGPLLKKPRTISYGYTVTGVKEPLEYRPKRNRLKEVADV